METSFAGQASPRQVAASRLASALLVIVAALQIANAAGFVRIGFADWRPVLYAFLALGRGARHRAGSPAWASAGSSALFVLPALLFTVAMVIFPTIFGLYIAFTDWNLTRSRGHHFNGLDNLRTLWRDPYFWNALGNMVFYVADRARPVRDRLRPGACCSTPTSAARKFFRVAFLLPFMLSPVAVSWMIGKSIMEYRFGPLATLASVSRLGQPRLLHRRRGSPALSIMAMDAWVSIPFMMILLLAGLQALPQDVKEAAKVDGANAWQTFWEITFPLMLPVSVTAIVLRIIFELKLADIVINVTAGGPGGATDTVSSFIYREYRDRSNVGYGTMVAEVYLVIIIIFITLLLNVASRYVRKVT